MADSPVRLLVKIGDPATAANEVGVDASGNLQVIAAANDGVDIGDVGIADFNASLTDTDDDIVAGAQTTLRVIGLGYGWDGTQWERLTTDASGALDVNETGGALTALQLIDDPVAVLGTATYAEATTKGNIVGVVRNDTLAALADTDNEIAPLQVNASGALYVEVSTIGTVTVDTELPAAGTISDDNTAAPSAPQVYGHMLGFDGTDWARVRTDTSGNLQVDVLTGGGESVPTGEAYVRATAADVAVDATLNVDEAEAQGTTTKVRGFDASASVPIKAELQSVIDGTGTPRVTLFAAAGEPIMWRAPHRDYFEVAHPTNAGFDGWRVVITNKDSTDAADLYGTIYTES